IYIYPRGKIGLDIAYLLEFIGYKKENIVFIDDAQEGLGLDSYIFNPQHKVLIASRKNYLSLASKLHKRGIVYEDGMDFIARELDRYFLETLKFSRNNTLGVITSGPSGSKHRGDIEKILKQRGVNVVFFCSSLKEMERAKDRIGDSVAFILNEGEILRRITFMGVALSECYEKFHHSVSVCYVSHTFATPNQSLAHDPCKSLMPLRLLIENNDYIFASCKQTYESWRDFCNYVYLEHSEIEDMIDFSLFYKVLPLGAPTLDRYYKDIPLMLEKIQNNRSKVDTFLVCLNTDYTNTKRAMDLVGEILKRGFKVIYRPHIMQLNSPIHKPIKEQYIQNPNFTFDDSIKLSLEVIARRSVLITDMSSLAFTYPIATLSPCILYLEDSWDFTTFIEKKLQIRASSAKEAVDAGVSIIENPLEFANTIIKYTQEDIYNFGCASLRIADFVEDILKITS
ncbi:MAG: hypothetical protein K2I71_08580, partial [Helicobacter sp.]|nr:hypothetical protein [Helicobacter sp.]